MPSKVGRVVCLGCGRFLPRSAATSGEACRWCGKRSPNLIVCPGVATGAVNVPGPKAIAKEKDPNYHSGKKLARERQVFVEVTRDDGVARPRRMDFDHMDDLYEETVLNPDGSIYHHNAEPLGEHRHHGSDKPKT